MRKHLVESAAYWFRNAFAEGQTKAGAIHSMENAYNHVENALATALADSARMHHWLTMFAKHRESCEFYKRRACTCGLAELQSQ